MSNVSTEAWEPDPEVAAKIDIAGGPTLELKAGDIASLPKGAQTTWYLTLPFKEFWVIG